LTGLHWVVLYPASSTRVRRDGIDPTVARAALSTGAGRPVSAHYCRSRGSVRCLLGGAGRGAVRVWSLGLECCRRQQQGYGQWPPPRHVSSTHTFLRTVASWKDREWECEYDVTGVTRYRSVGWGTEARASPTRLRAVSFGSARFYDTFGISLAVW